MRRAYAAAEPERRYMMPTDQPYTQFVELLKAFVSSHDRSRRQVAAIENEFAKHFDSDPRFDDLQYELAMYGVDEHLGDTALVKACERAMNLLSNDRRPT